MIPYRQLSLGLNFLSLHAFEYFLLRVLHFPRLRDTISWLIAKCLVPAGRSQTKLSARTSDIAARIDAIGFSRLSPLLDQQQLDEVESFLSKQPVFADGKEISLVEAASRLPRANYQMETILACPHILQAINNPEVLAIAENFLGCKPTIAALGMHWSFPGTDQVTDVQRFHRDCIGWRMLNMFIYLTDVDMESGPHRYILCSHRGRGHFRLTPYSEEFVLEKYGSRNSHSILGPKGTTFLENGWGIHEATPPVSARRLILAIIYSTAPIPIFDYDRIKIQKPHDCDPYVNRLFFA